MTAAPRSIGRTLLGIRSAALPTAGALPILAAPLATLAATGPTIRPAGSVLLGEEEGDRLPVQAREVLKLDHINPALP